VKNTAKQAGYRLGPDVPDTEVLRDRRGRVIDGRYVEEAAADALRKVRARGRPSLSEKGESPLLRVRVPRELDNAVRRAARSTGRSRADWVREVLDEASRKTG
jgi:predicted HicB family RNase H-like nuclease